MSAELPHSLARAIREEIRIAFMWGIDDARKDIPVHDLSAERVVLSSQIEAWETLELQGVDFFAPVHGAMWDAMAKVASLGAVDRFRAALALVRVKGFGMAFELYVEDTLMLVPATAGKPLRELAATLRELARRRRCIDRMMAAKILVLDGKAEEAIDALRTAVKELRG